MAEDDSEERARLHTAWMSPRDALKLCYAEGWDWSTTVATIGTRMKSGLIDTMARHVAQPGKDRLEYVLLKHEFWRDYWSPTSDHDFWKTGDIEIRGGRVTGYGDDRVKVSFFGVKFDPDAIRAMLPATGESTLPTPQREIAVEDRQRQLASGDAEKFSRAILAGWPDATEEWAREKALLFYPEHKIPRDWFRDIFRAIRGPKKRGKQPKNPV